MYIRKTARCNFAERREREHRSYRFDPRRGCSTKFSPGTRNFLVCARRRPGDNAEERRQDLPPHRAGCECGGEREGGRKGEEDSYVYVRPLVLPSQIHEANIGRKNGVEEVKEPATILLLLLLLPRYCSTRFSPPHDDTTRPVCLNFEETGSRDVFVERKWDRTIFRF